MGSETERISQLEAICQVANDTLCAIDLWLGMASTRQAADDSIWRLHRMLQQAGWDYSWRHYLDWRGAMIKELNDAGFFVGADGLFHYDPTADKEKPYRVYGNAVGPTLAEVIRGFVMGVKVAPAWRSDTITAQALRELLAVAVERFSDKVIKYSLALDEGELVYAGFVFNETPNIQMFGRVGPVWIYIGDYWPYESVWIEVDNGQ